MPKIAISYRREDSRWVAGRIFDHLEDAFGTPNVFIDIDAIPAGVDFREHIRQVFSGIDLLVVLIGPEWAGPNKKKILNPSDFVRIEIEMALSNEIPTVPVLVDGAKMPNVRMLPESLHDFAFRQAVELNSKREFRTDIRYLIQSIKYSIAANSYRAKNPWYRLRKYLGTIFVVIPPVLAWFFFDLWSAELVVDSTQPLPAAPSQQVPLLFALALMTGSVIALASVVVSVLVRQEGHKN